MSVIKVNTHSADSLHLSDLRIVMLGSRWAGKSSSGNTILGRKEFDLRTSAQCVKRQGEVAGRQVTVVDTPGWWENYPIEKTPELIKQEIMLSVSLCPPGPHTLLLVIRVDRSFTEEHRRSIEEHLGLLSELVWSHTIVLFTWGDSLGDTTIEQHIESEGKDLQWLVEKCGNRYHVLNNMNRGDGTQVTELLEKIEEMVAGNSGDYFVIYPKMGKEKINFGPEEPPTPLEDTDHHLASMSGDHRPETGYEDEQMSECGTLVEIEIKGMGLDELWKKPSLPIKGARSIELPPPSMSEDTIPESGYDEEPISECGTLVESKMKGMSLEEMWKKPSLPIKGARSIEHPPPSLSSRSESGFNSEQRSEGASVAESLQNPKKRMLDFISEDPKVLQ
uniref:AIG1-type G domain-containing protein n=1 Tax=Esox lucius TaxID=8010 RepID=A0A6Q2XNE3_ESOLU